ncbi:protein of unknown function [Magnetospirillum sp. XM-1]|nr:protein of unknown function [Magnetospirillum sp. XM-1]
MAFSVFLGWFFISWDAERAWGQGSWNVIEYLLLRQGMHGRGLGRFALQLDRDILASDWICRRFEVGHPDRSDQVRRVRHL